MRIKTLGNYLCSVSVRVLRLCSLFRKNNHLQQNVAPLFKTINRRLFLSITFFSLGWLKIFQKQQRQRLYIYCSYIQLKFCWPTQAYSLLFSYPLSLYQLLSFTKANSKKECFFKLTEWNTLLNLFWGVTCWFNTEKMSRCMHSVFSRRTVYSLTVLFKSVLGIL